MSTKEGGNDRKILNDETAESANDHIIIRMMIILLGDASPNKTIHAKVKTEKRMCIEKQICVIKLKDILV